MQFRESESNGMKILGSIPARSGGKKEKHLNGHFNNPCVLRRA